MIKFMGSKIKPAHYNSLSKYARGFEKEFKDVLKDETHVSLEDYEGAYDFVNHTFGTIKEIKDMKFTISEEDREEIISDVGVADEIDKEGIMVSSFYKEIIVKYGSFSE